MIQYRALLVRLSQCAAVAAAALILMVVGVLIQHSPPAVAAGCNTVLTDFSKPGWPKAFYYNPGFYEGKCVDGNRAFPNTGAPYDPDDGNVDSVGYVIPRTYKSTDYTSEALSNVNTKAEFYDKMRYHYFDRVAPARGQLGYWAKDGAAFVVFSFIGKTPPADRNLSNADWAEFKRRLDNPKLTLSIDNSHAMSPNSGSVYDTDGRLDFAHFYDQMGTYGPALVFKINGQEVASIERKCANLLGQVELPEAPRWTTSAQSRVGVNFTPPNVASWGDAKPNQMLYWRHTISASEETTPSLGFAIVKSGFSGANVWGDGQPANHNNPIGATGPITPGTPYNIGWSANYPQYSAYRVMPSDGGRTLCQGVSWGPSDYTKVPGDPWSANTPACVTVPYNFNLIPSVSGVSGIRTVGAPINNINPSVLNELPGNASQTTNSSNADWRVTRIEVAPGSTIKGSDENNIEPCPYYGNTCIPKTNGSQVFQAGGPTSVAAPIGETVSAGALPGTQICYALSVKPYSQVNNEWRHGVPSCITVGKQPKVQVLGHDLRTRGKILTGVTSTTTKTFGSWVEYGGFSVGPNSGFASASGLNNGNDSPAPNDWHKLTFANVNQSGGNSYGNFTLPSLPAITSQFIGTPGGEPSSDLGSLSSGTYQTGDFTINDTSAIGQSGGIGKSIIVVSTGTVTIKKNITYSAPGPGDTFSNPRELPQVVIIARNINIENDATQVDAWLLTTGDGSINTCSNVQPVTSALNSKVCDKPLVVNGAVATQHLYLRRTAGSDTVPTAGSPAEVFNLRPDAFMWAYARASQAGKAQTVYSVELPPRF